MKMSAAKKKNNAISDAVREKGNKCFCKKDYFEALRLYNEALRYAEIGSHQMGLAYANRSAVFLKKKLYKTCLDNIQLAKDHGFPNERLSKLISRESECMASMNAPMEEPWNGFFKLSYQPNPSFPFLVDCLELKKHERGMYLATKRDLKAGDIIAITEPIFRFPTRSVYRCNYCLADQFMNYIPCTGCVDVMFCDEKCMEKAIAEFHQFECGITDNPTIPKPGLTVLRMIMKCLSICDGSSKQLKKLVPRTMDRLITPFDFQLNDPLSVSSQKNLLLAHFSMNQRFDCVDDGYSEDYSEIQPFLQRHPKLQQIVTWGVYKSCVNLVECADTKIFRTVDRKILSDINKSVGLSFFVNYFGGAIEICYNLFLHSCAPTVYLHPYNGKIVWIVLSPIRAGDWLTVAYQNAFFTEQSLEDRKIELPNVLCCCECVACDGKWKPISFANIAPLHILCRSSEDAITAYKKYCEEMNGEALAEKCNVNLWSTIGLFRWNLPSIGKATF